MEKVSVCSSAYLNNGASQRGSLDGVLSFRGNRR